MNKTKKKAFFYTESTALIDYETGEYKKVEEIKRGYVEKEPDYIKLYVSDIMRLKGLPPASEKLMMLIVKNMGYNNLFFAFKPLKEIFSEQLGMTLNTLQKSIDNLKKVGLLIPIPNKRGCYIVDPNLFGRGKWEDIKELRLIIDYKADGSRTLKSNAPD